MTFMIGSLQQNVATTLLALGIWQVAKAIYNAYLGPLSKLPGPRLAAFTTWWKFYVEIVQKRSFAHELLKLHAIYGA